MKTEVQGISINGVDYIPKSTVPSVPQVASAIKIVILQRGWVIVGFYKRDGDNCSLTNASVLRNFGTTRGLGEIAQSGPTKDTKLDPCNGLVEFHRLTEVATISCEVSRWSNKLV